MSNLSGTMKTVDIKLFVSCAKGFRRIKVVYYSTVDPSTYISFVQNLDIFIFPAILVIIQDKE